MTKPKSKIEYRRPEGGYIDICEAPKLIALEETRDELIHALMDETTKVLELNKGREYQEALPEVFLALFNSWDKGAVMAAIEAFIARDGVKLS